MPRNFRRRHLTVEIKDPEAVGKLLRFAAKLALFLAEQVDPSDGRSVQSGKTRKSIR